ncbi:hypothetical protein SCLCIDRAFT_37143, partial [Scleroderma citrinum Foug A]
MDYINEVFTTGMLKQQCFDLAICVAVGLAKKTLNKYYECTDLSKLYRITMVLHPHHKLEYFRHANWEAKWIGDAHQLVCNTYNFSYATRHIPDCSEESAPKMDTCEDEGNSNNIFDSLPSLSKLNSTNECDELDRYLATGVEDIASGGAIKWWHNHHSKYPCL